MPSRDRRPRRKGAVRGDAGASRRRAPNARRPAAAGAVRTLERGELARLRRQLADTMARSDRAPRWNADPEEVRRSVAKLVLSLVEFLRQLMERQAIRRMEARTLTRRETEAIGVALMRLEETIREMARRFGIPPEELNLDLGPLGRLM